MAGVPKDRAVPGGAVYEYKQEGAYRRKWSETDGNLKLDEKVIKQVGAMLSLGMPYYQVAEVIGVTDVTLRAWRWKGKEDVLAGNEKTLYAKLHLACAGAKSKGIANALQALVKIMVGYQYTETRIKLDTKGNTVERTETSREMPANLSALRWYLERRDPANWGPDKDTEPALPMSDWREAIEERLGIDPSEFSGEITANIVRMLEQNAPSDDAG